MTGPLRDLADQLLLARAEGRLLDRPGAALIPATAGEAYLVDDLVAQELQRPVLGWKIGCTSEAARQILNADGPFSGRVYDIAADGAELAVGPPATDPLLEGEFAFSLATDLVATDRTRSWDEVVDAIAAVHPAIEVVGGRFADFVGTPLHCLVADAGANSLLVCGPALEDFEADAIGLAEATMTIDDEVTGAGHGTDVLGHPIDALCWLVEHLSARGIDLTAGQIITTGTATQLSPLPAGATATATFEGIGSVSLSRPAAA